MNMENVSPLRVVAAQQEEVPAWLLELLELPPDATLAEAEAAIRVLKEYDGTVRKLQVMKMVDEALQQRKLHSYEREWAIERGLDDPAFLAAFIRGRGKISLPLAARRKSSTAPDDLQKRINAQVGVSDATFARYNSAPPIKIEAAQAEMNAKVGVKPEVFAKYFPNG